MKQITMEQQNGGIYGLCAAVFGQAIQMMGAFWNVQSMQLIGFLFTALGGLGAFIYYITKSAIDVYKTFIKKDNKEK